MRAQTKKKHKMGKRFAILIGVAATGVMALGAQTGAQTQAPTPRGQAPPTCKGKPATIVGSDNTDRIKGTPGRDVIVGLGEHDLVKAGRGNDLICGGAGWDRLIGGKGRDRLLGQAAGDFLQGARGSDTLLGQAGGDVLIGGPDKDGCNGGKGIDTTTYVGFPGEAISPSDFVCEVEKSIERSGVPIH